MAGQDVGWSSCRIREPQVVKHGLPKRFDGIQLGSAACSGMVVGSAFLADGSRLKGRRVPDAGAVFCA